MYAIMTVTGADSTGIIAAVTTTLAELDINVIDVSQTLMGGYFTMILRVEFDADKVSIQTIKERMRPRCGRKAPVHPHSVRRPLHRHERNLI